MRQADDDRHANPAMTAADADRVREVFTEHQAFIENVARKFTRHEEDVADIVQDVGLRLCRDLNGFRGESALKTWLYKVTATTTFDHYRRNQKHVRVTEALIEYWADDTIDPDEEVLRAQRVDTFREALSQLPKEYQDTINGALSDYAGEPNGAGANVNESTRRTRLHRARQKMRDMLQDHPRFR